MHYSWTILQNLMRYWISSLRDLNGDGRDLLRKSWIWYPRSPAEFTNSLQVSATPPKHIESFSKQQWPFSTDSMLRANRVVSEGRELIMKADEEMKSITAENCN